MLELEQNSALAALQTKKIWIATESLGPINGVSRATQALLDYLQAQQIQTAVIAPRFSGKTEIAKVEATRLVRLEGWPLLYNPDLRVVRPFRVSRLFQKAFRPDVIYLASPASLGLQLWWQLRRSGIPLVANFQTDLAYYARLMLPQPLNRAAGHGIDWLTGHFLRHPSLKTVIYPSNSSRDYLLKLGVAPEKLQMVGRGVDCQLFNPSKRSAALREKLAPNGEILLLCVSRLSLEKGFEWLALAYEALTRQAMQLPASSPKFRLILTGGNSNPAIEQTVRRFFTERNLDVHFTGPLVGEPLAEMFASADIFVFPSLTETFGQVIQEAMASGLPVIARRKGGPADLVIPGETGFLAEPEDIHAFAKGTLTLIQQPELRARFGQNARRLAETRSWNSVNERIVTLLADVAN
jgi:glycosyltransferase involved in cell wall biosynthesis